MLWTSFHDYDEENLPMTKERFGLVVYEIPDVSIATIEVVFSLIERLYYAPFRKLHHSKRRVVIRHEMLHDSKICTSICETCWAPRFIGPSSDLQTRKTVEHLVRAKRGPGKLIAVVRKKAYRRHEKCECRDKHTCLYCGSSRHFSAYCFHALDQLINNEGPGEVGIVGL
jgi:5-methylcytosine-specific restriction endonuclease McrA